MKKNSAKKTSKKITKSSGISKSSRAVKKNHKPAMAIASLFFVFNGLLLYMSSPEGSGSGGNGIGVNPHSGTEKKTASEKTKKVEKTKPQISDGRSLAHFVIKNNKIYYQKKQITIQEFDKITMKLSKQKKHPQLFFHETTVAKGFYDDIRKRLRNKNITFSESFSTPKK